MHSFLLDILVCPACHGSLRWAIYRDHDDHLESAEASCTACSASYPVRESIAVFLTPDLPREDLWEQTDTGLTRHLRENPDIEQRLLETPLERLNPADQFFRAMVLEAKGDFKGSEEAEQLALRGLYTNAYLDCWQRQVSYLVDRLHETSGPIIDLASGRCEWVRHMLRQLTNPIVASDFSLTVMKRNRAWLQYTGDHRRVSLLCFDAKRTPFKTGSVQTLTTNVGLPNIKAAAELHEEIRRILSGTFFAISHFYPPGDENAQTISQAGLADRLYHRPATQWMRDARLQVQVQNLCRGAAAPTPAAEVIAGARIDGLPVAETQLEWCVLEVT